MESTEFFKNCEASSSYIGAKIVLLKHGFYINLTAEEIAHLYSLKSEVAVDNAVRKLLRDYFADPSLRKRGKPKRSIDHPKPKRDILISDNRKNILI